MDTSVGLVKSYLELCGYFVLAELPLRAPARQGYHDVTDLDIVAVRFPHEPQTLPERVSRPMEIFLGRDPTLQLFEEGVDLIIGEVKEGRARLNPALQRAETIGFAMRRVGCCPSDHISDQARRIARRGYGEMTMLGGATCRVRVVAFAGHSVARETGVLTVSLRHCIEWIASRFEQEKELLAGARFKDPILSWFALEAKLAGGATSRTALLLS